MRKHSGINKKTGKLKKGYKYSGKKLKSGLSQIVKTQKGGGKKVFKPKDGKEKKYRNCKIHECKTDVMSYCCEKGTPAEGYCRINKDDCFKKGIMFAKPRKGNLSIEKLKKLRKNMGKDAYIKKKDMDLIKEKGRLKDFTHGIYLELKELYEEKDRDEDDNEYLQEMRKMLATQLLLLPKSKNIKMYKDLIKKVKKLKKN